VTPNYSGGGQQIGGALGLAVLTAASTARARSLTPAGLPEAGAITQGWSLAFLVAVGMTLTAIVITLVMINPSRPSC
jgi:hypothetical protein